MQDAAVNLNWASPAFIFVQLKIAYKLLMDKKVTKVSTLAAAVGFDNIGYFSRQFLERFGKKPAEFL
jgi:YesN/AraC family two-component response regulator